MRTSISKRRSLSSRILLGLAGCLAALPWKGPLHVVADETAPPVTTPEKASGALFQGVRTFDIGVHENSENDGVYSLYVTRVADPQAAAIPPKMSEYWIGISGNPVDDVLRAHLELPENQGLLLGQVIPDSPAAKAGLKVNDILLSVEDKGIRETGDLAAVVEDKKETTLKIKLIRAGKPIFVEVTPQRRPPSQTGATCPKVSTIDDAEFARRVWLDLLGTLPEEPKLKSFVEDTAKDKRESLVNRLLRRSTTASKSCTACHSVDEETARLSRRLIHPKWTMLQEYSQPLSQQYQPFILTQPYVTPNGLLVQPGVENPGGYALPTAIEFPDDLSISVTRKGKEPAQIVVRRGEQSWECTEKNYQEKLPAELRGYVGSMLTGRGTWGLQGMRSMTMPPLGNMGGLGGAWQFDRSGKLKTRRKARAVDPTGAEAAPAAVEPPAAAPSGKSQEVDQRIEQLSEQLEGLRKALQELREGGGK